MARACSGSCSGRDERLSGWLRPFWLLLEFRTRQRKLRVAGTNEQFIIKSKKTIANIGAVVDDEKEGVASGNDRPSQR
ncbi:hypothetical protein Pmar_PMAR009994 [Perkinsus marinus ATCC 50983]|uniref:Uncharacterized protein n=1 Tax=Perkinsus marinus (strain ATCC 50983 / TXsc) TaxID=423536 RepID=C5L2T7_PERM5|nr:hypothetical protein Pmar_PMAR009994 [Perkinsus marinus ATCC 50983]EER09002.1 hypothetical protein Pmar_PMAR009994 [Perkinsus marinus ATCC 50983]|eukprot:XP_002777186.1 hypothetical protein Pmar_PMAR009994 [Perkinsus marinus ATCC 50983]